MNWREISSGSFTNCAYVTRGYDDIYVHCIHVTGTFGRQERIPLYKKTLDINLSNEYYCIIDNSEGHEYLFALEDMMFVKDTLSNAGIRWFYCAIVTKDLAKPPVIRLAETVAELGDIKAEMLSTPDYEEAERFILSKLKLSIRQNKNYG